MTAHAKLHLASASPRRRQILADLGLSFSVASVAIDESPQPDEAPQDLVLRLATEKAAAATAGTDNVIVAADTVVVVDNSILGKPADRAAGIAMLQRLSGRRHIVMTGVAVLAEDVLRQAVSRTEVEFREIGRDEALRYWQSGEPRDKAGGYGIQGRGGVFVRSISGSYSGVVGLPVYETAELLRAAGVDVMASHD